MPYKVYTVATEVSGYMYYEVIARSFTEAEEIFSEGFAEHLTDQDDIETQDILYIREPDDET